MPAFWPAIHINYHQKIKMPDLLDYPARPCYESYMQPDRDTSLHISPLIVWWALHHKEPKIWPPPTLGLKCLPCRWKLSKLLRHSWELLPTSGFSANQRCFRPFTNISVVQPGARWVISIFLHLSRFDCSLSINLNREAAVSTTYTGLMTMESAGKLFIVIVLIFDYNTCSYDMLSVQ